MRAGLILVAMVAVVLVAACAPGTPAPTTAPSFQPATFFAQNCAACHGEEAWGSQVAPPLVGMPVDEIQVTVRDPNPPMPSFGTGEISDADLAVLAAYLNALAPPSLAEDLKVHLEAARRAAEAPDKDATELHLQEAIGLAPAEIVGSLEFILEEAEAEEFGEVEEFIGSLLGEAHE